MRIGGYEIPKRLLYVKEHTWLSIDKHDVGRVGVTDYLQKALHEITFIYLPKNDLEVRRLQVIATVESVKALSEIYSPISGRIIEVNQRLVQNPALINCEPYTEGWIAVIQPSAFGEEKGRLLGPKQYAEYVKRLRRMDEARLQRSHIVS